MTEKRFTLNRVGRERIIDGIVDNETDELLDNQMDFCERLNALHEENQKLLTLSNMKKGALVEAVKDLTKENEQLKHDATVLICSNQEYRKENEQLKSEIKDLNDVLARYEEKHQEECIYEYMKLIGEDTLNEMNKSK